MIASILLDSEATEGSISVDPSYGGIKEPILKVTNLMRSIVIQNGSLVYCQAWLNFAEITNAKRG